MMIKPKILLVEDVLEMQAILSAIFKNSRFDLVTASNGNEAIKFLDLHKNYEMIILDYQLPDMNGMELLKIIQEKCKMESKIPKFCFFTSTKDFLLMETALKAGAAGFITKPISRPASILEKIDSMLI